MLVPNAGAEEAERLPPRNARLHLNAKLIVSLGLVCAVFLIAHLHLQERYDFGVFYFAAHMVLDGARHSLYDINAQHAFQALYHRPPEMTFRNPPVALLPMLPLAKAPQSVAYLAWISISFALLLGTLKVLQDQAQAYYGNWPILLAPAFVPIMACFLHGQFTLVIVASFALTCALWRRDRPTLGGLVLSIAMIKFQLVVGLIPILVLKRKWRELFGLACGSAILLALSAWMIGIRALLSYPSFLLQSEPLPELPHMANWHGLLAFTGLNSPLLLLPLCFAAITWATLAWKDLEHGFAAATLAAALVSYHLTPQDLALLVVPFYLCIQTGILPRTKAPAFAVAVIVGFFVLVTLHVPFALLALPLACALWWVGRDPRSNPRLHAHRRILWPLLYRG